MKYVAIVPCLSALLLLSACRPSPEKLLATANKYHANKKYREASILYQKVIAKDKKNAEAYYREGLNLLDEGSAVQAMPYLRRAVDLNPNNSDAVAKLAEIELTAYLSNPKRFKANLLPDIQDLKTKLLQRDPNSFDGLRIQAMLDLSDRNLNQAVQDFAKATAAHPYSRQLVGWYAEALMATGHQDQAEAEVRDMLAHDKTWGPGYDFLALLYARNKDVAKEEALLRAHVQNDPKSAAAVVNLATFLRISNRYDEGEKLMQRMLADRATFPAAREMMGNFYVAAKQFEKAIDQYQQGAKEDPAHANLYNERIVLVYDATGRRDEAVRLAKSLYDKNPKDAHVSEMYAGLLLDTGLRADANKTIDELGNLIKNNGGDPVLHLDLAKAYWFTNNADKALSQALESMQDEAKSHTPRNNVIIQGRLIAAHVYEAKGQHAQALDQTNQIIAIENQNPEARLIRDEALVGLNEPDQAQPDLEKLVQQIPNLTEAHLALGNAYLAERNPGKAQEEFQKVVAANDPRGYVKLEETKLVEGKVDEAVKGMTELVDKNPGQPAYRYELANVETEAAQMVARSNTDRAKSFLGQAIDNYKQVLKSTPNAVEVWLRLGTLQQTLGQLDQALASFEQVSHIDPRNAPALINRGVILEAQGKKKDASDIYNQALGIDPNNPIALNNLAFIDAENGTNLDQAMSFAERAKKQAPKSPDVSDTLGYVYYRKNLNSAALDIFRQNVQDQPQNPTFHLHLAMALLKSGDKQGARTEAEKALKIAPPGQQEQIKSFVSQIG
ncbi:MAG: tetratricopeptide repeat protein [Acidobacteriaceae bacterium]|nr:tetratricopeptide repeat protein [Acidobacteriaceae bacterium]